MGVGDTVMAVKSRKDILADIVFIHASAGLEGAVFPGQRACQQGGRSRRGEVSSGIVIMIDYCPLAQAGYVGCCLTLVTIQREMVSRPGIKNDHKDVLAAALSASQGFQRTHN